MMLLFDINKANRYALVIFLVLQLIITTLSIVAKYENWIKRKAAINKVNWW